VPTELFSHHAPDAVNVSEAAGDRSVATAPSSGVCQTTSTVTVPVRASACTITGEFYAAIYVTSGLLTVEVGGGNDGRDLFRSTAST
jgi:hypothetical protein